MVPPAMPFGSLWVVYQLPGQQGQHGLVGAAGHPGKQANACPGQGTDRAEGCHQDRCEADWCEFSCKFVW